MFGDLSYHPFLNPIHPHLVSISRRTYPPRRVYRSQTVLVPPPSLSISSSTQLAPYVTSSTLSWID